MKRFSSPAMGLLLLSFVQAGCGGGTGNSPGLNGDASPTGAGGEAGRVGNENKAGASSGSSKPGSKSNSGSGKTKPRDETKDTSSGGAENTADPGDAGSPSTDPSDVVEPPRVIDEDTDGVLDDADLCPGTPAGVQVNATGCELSKDLAAQTPWGQPVPADVQRPVPETGSVEENGFMNFVVDANSRFPMVFRARASNVQKLEHGFHIAGTLLLDVPGGTITLTDVDVTLEYGASVSAGLDTLHGSARVPFPDFGVGDKLELDAPIAELGLAQGKSLKDLKAPLVDDRRYLYFHFSDQLTAKVGPMLVELPAASEHTLVLDHTDPMFFMRASLTGVPGMPLEIKDAGVGFSRQGLMPFKPSNTWGAPPSSDPKSPALGFSGQMYLELSGGVEIPETPLMLTGESVNVIDLDPARTGRTVFADPENGLRLGANRALGVKLDLIPGTASFELNMADGSLDLSLLKNAQTAFISGVTYPGKSFFNDVVPILPGAEVKVAAVIAKPIADSRFALAGNVSLALSKLGALTGLSLNDVPITDALLTVDKTGLYVHGNASASLLQSLGIGAGATFDAAFPGSAEASNWYVDMSGNFTVSGVRLSGTTQAHLDRAGVAVNGRLSTALGGVAMSGRIDRSGVNLAGSVGVSIPIVAGRTETQTFVNGAVCGYQTVQSGAICGYETLKGFGACGVNYAKECLVRHHCSTPTCFGAANSCPDPSKPLSCPQTVTVPQFNYGTFSGQVQVSIGSNGASGALVGRYCTSAGACQSLPTAAVDVSSSKACIQIPGLPQAFCTSF